VVTGWVYAELVKRDAYGRMRNMEGDEWLRGQRDNEKFQVSDPTRGVGICDGLSVRVREENCLWQV